MTRDQHELKKSVQRCAFNILMHDSPNAHAKNLAFFARPMAVGGGPTLQNDLLP
jgi:hypothetical protein